MKNNMNERDFAYWLRGFFEISNPKEIKEAEVKMIKKHLDSVFDDVIMEKEKVTTPVTISRRGSKLIC